MYRLRRYFPPDSRDGQAPPDSRDGQTPPRPPGLTPESLRSRPPGLTPESLRSRPPGPTPESLRSRPPVLMVHPMMMSADMWDVTRDDGAVGILHRAGIDPWVIDFGSPDRVEGGMQRNLADHIVALSQAIETVKQTTGKDIHLVGYSQGGMFAYQAAAFRQTRDIASIITFGSPVDTLAALPMNIPAQFGAATAEFMADHVFNRLAIPSWLARAGFQMLDPIKTTKSRLDFLRQLHDRDALLPREQQRRFLASEGWIAWSGPAISELLKQFIAHNRMMTGGFTVHDQLVTLNDINCPILAFVGEVDDIGQPASVRGIQHAAPRADAYEATIRAGHFGLVVGSKAAAVGWPTVAEWVRWLEGDGDIPDNVVRMAPQPAEHAPESGVALTDRIVHGAAVTSEVAFDVAKAAADAVVATNKTVRSLAIEAVRTLPRLARLGQINPHTRISLARIMSEQAANAPKGECLLFDGRVHTYEAVDTRINNVVRGLIQVGVRQGDRVGVLMETRPSALVAIAALSRLGAVAVLMPPDADLAAAARLGGVAEIITDPTNLRAATRLSL
ncbi:MAG: alpha/beta fold hydrolase, partial [Mycobacteriaceae bacterium]|nr:alpha/beta fold hydrolase [Mycobacteriaceae bacterium]